MGGGADLAPLLLLVMPPPSLESVATILHSPPPSPSSPLFTRHPPLSFYTATPSPPCQDLALDPTLESHKRALVVDAAQQLKASQMAVFDERSGNLFVTELGRVASHYYIRCEQVWGGRWDGRTRRCALYTADADRNDLVGGRIRDTSMFYS